MQEVNQTDFDKLLARVDEAETEIQRLSYMLDRCGIRLGSSMSFKGSNYMLNANMFQQWETGSSRPLTPADKYVKIENGTLNIYGGGINLNTSDGTDGLVIDENGVTLYPGDSWSESTSIKSVNTNGDIISKFYSTYGGGYLENDTYLTIEPITDSSSFLSLLSEAPVNKTGEIQLRTKSGGRSLACLMQTDYDSGEYNVFELLYTPGDTPGTFVPLRIYPSTGNTSISGSFQYSGDLTPYRNSTTYTGYIYVPLATPLTSTSWDGDAHSDESATKIDLSAVFGVPAGIKAISARLIARDSTTWGTNNLYVSIGSSATSYNHMEVRPAGGDVWAEVDGICTCNADGDIYYAIEASGTNTMDVGLQITGYYI